MGRSHTIVDSGVRTYDSLSIYLVKPFAQVDLVLFGILFDAVVLLHIGEQVLVEVAVLLHSCALSVLFSCERCAIFLEVFSLFKYYY